MRTVDSAQYTNRVQEYDFDMIVASFPQSSSPGNEQREFWGSAAGNRPGSRNVVGIDNAIVDELIENLIQAPSYDDLIPAVRALDRVLTWNFYVIPQFHARFDRIAYWNKFRRADTDPELGPDIFSWWVDPELEQNLREGKSSLQED
jgi:microcin C transport system substrate-binding protein